MSKAKSSPLAVAVLGGGRWARALAALLGYHQERSADRVSRVLQVREGSPMEELAQADLLILAAPATTLRPFLRQAAPHLHGAQFLVHAIGSLAPAVPEAKVGAAPIGQGLAFISEVVRTETPIRRVGALAGPALTLDLEERRPAALVCGSRFDEVGSAARQVLNGPTLRVYTTRDLLGVEVARAMVAVVALAGGMASTLDLGAAARAVLITRGAAETARLGVALGATERTFFGLAGVGEMTVATDGRGSADYELGRLIAQGVPLDDAQRQVGRVCDSPGMISEALQLGELHHLNLPLTSALKQILAGACDVRAALDELFSSDSSAE